MVTTLTIEVAVLGRPPTANTLRRVNYYRAASLIREWRNASRILWHNASSTELECPVTVGVVPLHKDRRSPQDVAACAPAAKACIDGAVDAGVLPDDTAEFVSRVVFCVPVFVGVDGLRVTLTSCLGDIKAHI